MSISLLLSQKSADLKNINLSLLQSSVIPKDDQITLEVLDAISEACSFKATHHPEWLILAGRIKVISLKYHTGETFSQSTEKAKILLNQEYYDFVTKNSQILNAFVEPTRDDLFDWFGVCTLLKSYLLKVKGKCVETPQHMFMRVAVWLWMSRGDTSAEGVSKSLQKIKETYDDMSLKNYIHATPTLFNSGARRPQLSSCFLMTVGDNLEAISKSWYDCAMISKNSGGIGIDITDIRHSEINNSNISSGVVPMLRVHNSIMNYVDQARKRKGSAAIYMAEWHVDIFDFLELKKQTGSEYLRARDLFYAVWTSDLFMKRVEADETYSLFCPNKAKGLNNVWGKEFEKLYLEYEKQGIFEKQVPARELWKAILGSITETGSPYILYKDACNRKSNQQNLGTIKCSNLCTEIIEYTSPDEIASCNLASVALASCVRFVFTNNKKTPIFDFSKLERLVRSLVRNLNQVIDINYYIDNIKEIKYANLKHRPLSIGCQALADVFAMMDYKWSSNEAKKLNIKIFETMYYASVTESIKMASERLTMKNNLLNKLRSEWKSLIDRNLTEEEFHETHVRLAKAIKDAENIVTNYSSFEGSPASKGFLQFDLWEAEKLDKTFKEITIEELLERGKYEYLSDRYDWKKVRTDMRKYGMRNSMLIGMQPTASTSHLLGYNECFEPFSVIMGTRTTLGGQFMIVNKYLANDVISLGVLFSEIANDIILNDGSIQDLDIKKYIENPSKEQLERFDFIKEKYKTAYELSQKTTAELSIDRGHFVCQAQSFNAFIKVPTYQNLTSFLFYFWRGGSKNGIYYCRSDSTFKASKISVGSKKSKAEIISEFTCSGEVCVYCT